MKEGGYSPQDENSRGERPPGERGEPVEQQWYPRELLAGFFHTLTRWQQVLHDDRFLLDTGDRSLVHGEGSFFERRAGDVVATPHGPRMVPYAELRSLKRNPELILRLRYSFDTRADVHAAHTHFIASPGMAGWQAFVDRTGEPLKQVEFEVAQAGYVGFTQWLSVHTKQLWVDYEVHNGEFQRNKGIWKGKEFMSDPYATQLLTMVDALIPAVPSPLSEKR